MKNDRTEYCLTIDIKSPNGQTQMLSIRGFFTDDDIDNFTEKVQKKYECITKDIFTHDPRQEYDTQSPEEALIVLKLNPDD